MCKKKALGQLFTSNKRRYQVINVRTKEVKFVYRREDKGENYELAAAF